MTCCIGKARIYYKEPSGFAINYKLKDRAWTRIYANETLSEHCLVDNGVGTGKLYSLLYTLFRSDGSIYEGPLIWPNVVLTGPAKTLEVNIGGNNAFNIPNKSYEFWSNYGTFSAVQTLAINNYGFGLWAYGEFNFISIDGSPDPYIFKIIGVDSGTEYVNIGGLKECPIVDNQGCVMGEEKYIDQLLPNQSPGGPVESSCFYQIPQGNNLFVNVRTTYKSIDNKALRPPKDRNVLFLSGLSGCPPEYRVECCGLDGCEPEEKCPPDTDCEVNCGSFKCCWKNGKLIKEINL